MELTFLNELMLICQVNQKNAIFVTIAIFLARFKFQPDIRNGYHGLLIIYMKLSNIAILSIRGADYRCIICGISKSKAINLSKH